MSKEKNKQNQSLLVRAISSFALAFLISTALILIYIVMVFVAVKGVLSGWF